MRGRSVVLVPGTLVLALTLAPDAQASTAFPQVIRSEWGVQNLGVPGDGCRLCHTTESGGASTAQEPFGRTVWVEYQVSGGNAAAFRSALQRIRRDGIDSDEDGVSDYEELINGTNVNEPDAPMIGEGGTGGESGGNGAGNEDPEPAPPRSARALPTLETGCSYSGRAGFSPRLISMSLAGLGGLLLGRRTRAIRRLAR